MNDLTTHEATELYLYASSNREPYERHLLPAYQLLERKWRRGTFDRLLGMKLLTKYTLIAIAKAYRDEHCDPASKWSTLFPPDVRQEVAHYLVTYLETELELGNSYLPAEP